MTVNRHSEADASGEDAAEGWSKTLPRSWRETKLLTNQKERDVDDQVIKERKQMVETMSPAKLAEMRGLSDFPLPVAIERALGKRSRSESETRKPKAAARQRRDSQRSASAESTGGLSSKFGSLPRSWQDTKLLTKQKVTKDPEELAKRRALTESQTPAQLGQITSLGEFPLPTTLENFFKEKKPKPAVDDEQ